jgi:hypothetical protein
MRQHLSQVAHVEQRSADRAIAEMIGLGFRQRRRGRCLDTRLLPSLIPRQLAASPMLVLSRQVEHAFDVTIQRSHHAYPGERRWPVMFRN